MIGRSALLLSALVIAHPAAGQTTESRPSADAARLDRPTSGPPPKLDLSSSATPARPRRIAVLILSGPQVGIPLSDVYAAARGVLEDRTALRVLPVDLLGMSDREAAIRECAGNPACFARRVRAVAATVDLLLTISLDQITDKLLMALRLVDIPTAAAIGASAEEIPFGMSLTGGIERHLPRVLPGTIWDQVSSVQIDSEPTNAEVTFGRYTCATPCHLRRIVPGTYPVSVDKAGFDPWTGSVSIAARRMAKVQADLQELEGDGVLSNPWFWGAVGLVAVGAGVLTFFLVQPSDQLVNVCISSSQDQCN